MKNLFTDFLLLWNSLQNLILKLTKDRVWTKSSNVLENTYSQINSVVFPTNMQMSVNFGETYTPKN